MARDEHPMARTAGNDEDGWSVVCKCGWATADYPTLREAYEEFGEHRAGARHRTTRKAV